MKFLRKRRTTRNESVTRCENPPVSLEPMGQSSELLETTTTKPWADKDRSSIVTRSIASGSVSSLVVTRSIASGSFSSLGVVTTFVATPFSCSSAAPAAASFKLRISLKSRRTRSQKQSAKSLIDETEQEASRPTLAFPAVELQPATGTRASQLAKFFEIVLTGDALTGAIDTEKLLRACKENVALLRDMGQRITAWEIEGNIKKLEVSCHLIPAHRRKTVSELLAYEKAMGFHQPGRLKDPSGAVALLWIRRSLSVQHRMYGMIVEKMDPVEAATEAYKAEMRHYHGWMLQKVALTLAKTAPSREDTLAGFGGFEKRRFGDVEEMVTVNDLRQLVSTMSPILARWKQIFEDLDMEDNRRV